MGLDDILLSPMGGVSLPSNSCFSGIFFSDVIGRDYFPQEGIG
jgi:hypothetical protein